MPRTAKILVAALDWGLGHVTRCMPIIDHMQSRGVEVVLAAAGRAGHLFKTEYPKLKYIDLPEYKPRYDPDGNMVWAMAKQTARFLNTISLEHELLKTLQRKHRFTHIISDNRYGLYNKAVPSIVLTHQLNILMPKGFGALKWFVDRLNRRHLSHFDHIWVPDSGSGNGLSGVLTQCNDPALIPKLEFLGPLSRLQREPAEQSEFELLVMLSGPEPQRTLLEDKLLNQLADLPYKTLFVQGATDHKKERWVYEHCKKVGYLTAKQVQQALNSIPLVVGRSGYSSVMDLVKLQHKALLIPTPGQTEQEYLATYLPGKYPFISSRQQDVDLKRDLAALQQLNPDNYPANPEMDVYKTVVDRLLEINP